MDLFMNWVSGGEMEMILQEYLKKTRFGRMYIRNKKFSDKLYRTVDCIKYLHTTCSKNNKSKVLSLISTLYSRTELKMFGINVSTTKHYNSLKHQNKSFH